MARRVHRRVHIYSFVSREQVEVTIDRGKNGHKDYNHLTRTSLKRLKRTLRDQRPDHVDFNPDYLVVGYSCPKEAQQ